MRSWCSDVVEAATFRGVIAEPLRIRRSRSSPGRYALHKMVENVYAFFARLVFRRELPLLVPPAVR